MEGKQVLFGGRYEHYFDFHYGKNKELLFARERPEVIEARIGFVRLLQHHYFRGDVSSGRLSSL